MKLTVGYALWWTVLVQVLLTARIAWVSAQANQELPPFSLDHDDRTFGFTFPFESVRESVGDFDAVIGEGPRDFQSERTLPFPEWSSDSGSDNKEPVHSKKREINLKDSVDASYSQRAPNAPPSGKRSASVSNTDYTRSAKPGEVRKPTGSRGSEKDKVIPPGNVDVTPLLHGATFGVAHPDALTTHQMGNRGDVGIIQKNPVQGHLAQYDYEAHIGRNESPRGTIDRHRVEQKKEEVYRPPVYIPRNTKAADPYKSHEHKDSVFNARPLLTYTDTIAAKPTPPRKVLLQPHVAYKPAKPALDLHKPVQVSYKPASYKPAHAKPIKKLEPVYKPARDNVPKHFHKKEKPLYDPFKPLEEEYNHHKKNSIPGEPGVDYPVYNTVPYTGFLCSKVPYRPGMYANVEAQCQAYHVCDDGRHGEQGAAFLCSNGTLFNQATFSCDWWYNVQCNHALQFYDLNLDPRHNPYYQKPYEGPVHIQNEYDDFKGYKEDLHQPFEYNFKDSFQLPPEESYYKPKRIHRRNPQPYQESQETDHKREPHELTQSYQNPRNPGHKMSQPAVPRYTTSSFQTSSFKYI